MWCISIVLALAIVLSGAAAWPHTNAIHHSGLTRESNLSSLIGNVTRSKLEPIVNDLTGKTSPLIGGSPFTIRTRFATAGRPSDMAEQYVYEHLRSYGLTSVAYQSFVRDGVMFRNVVGEIAGTTRPAEIVLVGPHLDSYSGTQSATLAPGADDNASGVAAALCMAKALASERFDRTIRFVFFDGEDFKGLTKVLFTTRMGRGRPARSISWPWSPRTWSPTTAGAAC